MKRNDCGSGAYLTRCLPYLVSTALACGCGEQPKAPVQPSVEPKREVVKQTPTFNRDIAPIVFKSCAPCHHEGESTSAPFPLLTYRDVKAHASQIAEVTASRYMPPWLVDESDFHFTDDARLTVEQIEIFKRWYDSGTPEGAADELPPAPVIVDGWQLGEPDLVVSMEEKYELRAEGPDEFRNFVAAIPLNEAKWVRAVEIRPVNPPAIHHAELVFDSTDGSRRLDERDPTPGFGGMEPGNAAGRPDGHFYGWVPGRAPFPGSDDVSWLLKQGTDLVLKLHMFPTGKKETVDMEVGFHFNTQPPTRAVTSINIGSRSIDIPAGKNDYAFKASYQIPVDVKVLAVAPHAHYLGKSLRTDAILPDGKRRTLFHMKNWDFNWQGEYVYTEPVSLPRGTQIEMQYVYDNSAKNTRNPHSPPQRVVYGPLTTDEMGDLNIRVEAQDFDDRSKLNTDVARHHLETVVRGLRDEMARDPKNVEARASFAGLLMSSGNERAAEPHLKQILELEPRHVYANSLMGALLIGRNEIQQALEHLATAIKEDPDHAEARQNLAAAMLQLGKPDVAAHHMAKAMEIRPNIKGHFFLGSHFYGQEKWEQSVSHFQAALEYEPSQAEVRYMLARSLWQQGEKVDAVKQLRETLRLQPNFAKALQMLQQIKADPSKPLE